MSIWESLGFKDNPYSAYPLSASAEDFGLFVGREQEGNDFRLNASTGERALMIVEGDVGVGKTSFVNIQQRISWKKIKSGMPHLLPSFQVIQLSLNMTKVEFILSVLSNVLYSVRKIYGKAKIKQSETLSNIEGLVNQQIDSRTGISFGATILGTGMQVGRQQTVTVTQPVAVVPQALLNTLDELYNSIKGLGFDGIFVPINNVDILPEDFAIDFLNELRDLFLIREGYWSTLITGMGFFPILESRAPRLSEMFVGHPIVLNPLDLNQVLEAISKRINKLRVDPEIQPPLSKGIVRLLHEISKGQIRYLFKRATNLMIAFKSMFPSAKTMTDNQALYLLKTDSKKQLDEFRLTKTEIKVLKIAVSLGSFRPRDFRKFNFSNRSALIRYLKEFEQHKLLITRRDPDDARAKIYAPSGDVQLLMGEIPDYLKI